MKTIEQKAKLYDEVVKRVENIKTGKCQKTFIFTEGLFEYIFPELAESEDERIRKTLIEFFSRGAECNSSTNGIPDKDIITWLEKQEEIKIPKWIFDFLEECRPYIGCALGYDERRDIDGKVVAVQKWLEKQGEHKQLKKIEQEYHCTGVREPKEATGVLKQLLNKENYAWSEEDEAYRVDILVKLEPHITDDNFTDVQNWFKSIKDRVQTLSKQEWSEEDKVKINRIVAFLENLNLKYLNVAGNDILLKDIEWLKSLKDRVQPKQEWSEEDENVINHLFAICAGAKRYRQFAGCSQDDVIKYQTWLKSLKDRYLWKPSERQMASITCAVRKMKESPCYDSELVSLLNDLKKLKKRIIYEKSCCN